MVAEGLLMVAEVMLKRAEECFDRPGFHQEVDDRRGKPMLFIIKKFRRTCVIS